MPWQGKSTNFFINQAQWIGHPIFHETVEIESMNSSKTTLELTALIKQQSLQYDIIKDNLKKLKNEKEFKGWKLQKRHRKINNKNEWQRKTSCGYINSNWSFKLLTILPITEFGFELSKQQFWNSIRLQYGWEISNLPTLCLRGSEFDIQYSMSCKVVLYPYDIMIYET